MLDVFIAFAFVGLRAVGVVFALPSPGGGSLPVMLRGGVCLIVSVLIGGIITIPDGLVNHEWDFFVTSALRELLLGFAMGFVLRSALSISAMGGRLISNEIGLSSPPGFDVPIPAQEPLPSLLTAFAGVMFFSLGLHHDVLTAFARSFEISPLGSFSISSQTLLYLVRSSGDIFVVGLRLAAPFIALNFVTNLAFGLMGRAVPRMNVFVESVSLRLWAGLLLLAGSGALIWRNLDPQWQQLPWTMLELCINQVKR